MGRRERAVPLATAVGAAVKAVREQRRMRQVDLADAATKVGLPATQTGIARIEKGHNLTLEVIIKLAVALNVTPLAFITPDECDRIDLGGGRVVDSSDACRWWMGLGPLLPERDYRAYERVLPGRVMDALIIAAQSPELVMGPTHDVDLSDERFAAYVRARDVVRTPLRGKQAAWKGRP